jgi:hypothetical protein
MDKGGRPLDDCSLYHSRITARTAFPLPIAASRGLKSVNRIKFGADYDKTATAK